MKRSVTGVRQEPAARRRRTNGLGRKRDRYRSTDEPTKSATGIACSAAPAAHLIERNARDPEPATTVDALDPNTGMALQRAPFRLVLLTVTRTCRCDLQHTCRRTDVENLVLTRRQLLAEPLRDPKPRHRQSISDRRREAIAVRLRGDPARPVLAALPSGPLVSSLASAPGVPCARAPARPSKTSSDSSLPPSSPFLSTHDHTQSIPVAQGGDRPGPGASPGRPHLMPLLPYWTGTTFAACMPFAPCSGVYSTFAPSDSDL